MGASLLLTLLVVGLMVIYGGLAVGTIFMDPAEAENALPFRETDKLLRSPGESLKCRIAHIDEEFTIKFSIVCASMVIILPLGAWLAKRLGLSGWHSLIEFVLPPLFIASLSPWQLVRGWKLRSDCFLGWFGERVTAEHLRPLQLIGYRVFHDVPCIPGPKDSNIHHAVAGPTVLSVVETEPKRKGHARPGSKITK